MRINLINVCNYVCVGHFTNKVDGRPKLHERGNPDLLICIPKDPKREKDEIIWLQASTMDQLK